MNAADINVWFTYHVPDAQRILTHQKVRQMCQTLAHNLNGILPEGREKSLAITHLEEVMFWSSSAIARDGKLNPKERTHATQDHSNTD